jgi:hypothetical protein
MSHPPGTAQIACTRLISGVIAFLLLCNATLLAGTQKPKTAMTGLWYAGHQAPLFTVFTYFKDVQRNAEALCRDAGEGDDPLNQPLALETYPQLRLRVDLRSGSGHPRHGQLVVLSDFRPQSPRAPPLA